MAKVQKETIMNDFLVSNNFKKSPTFKRLFSFIIIKENIK